VATNFANTLYANMLRASLMEKAQREEQRRFDMEMRTAATRQMIDQGRLLENAKDAEFSRHAKVAELESRAAAMRGDKTGPGGYFNPAIGEMARAAFGSGQVDRMQYEDAQGAAAAKRKLEEDKLRQEMDLTLFQEQGRNDRALDERLGAASGDWDLEKSPEFFRHLEKRYGVPEGSMGERPYGQRWAPKEGGRGGKADGPLTMEDLAENLRKSGQIVRTDLEDEGGPKTSRHIDASNFAFALALESGLAEEQKKAIFSRKFPEFVYLLGGGGGGVPSSSEGLSPADREALKSGLK
jgi:hypothetical protein